MFSMMAPQAATPLATAPLDPETLFESRTVDEITAFSRSLTQEIDRKREELRTMVGERYRDLMEAADTITKMRESADMVVATVDGVISRGAETRFKKFSPVPAAAARESGEEYLAVAANIKLLMMAPEKVWSAVDAGDYLEAARIFLFARHVHTSLEMSSSSGVLVAQHFPVVSRQWASIAHFHEAILQGCRETMLGGGEAEKTVRAMAAVVLLKGVTAEELFCEFLALRKSALKSQLEKDGQKETAKVMIERSLVLVRTTIDMVRLAFVDGGLIKTLEEVAVPTLPLFETRLSPVFKLLPAIIGDFCPCAVGPVVKLESSLVSCSVVTWLDDIHGMITKETTSVLSHVNSIPAVSAIRKSCYDHLNSRGGHLSPERWNEVCKSVLGKDLNLWDEFYRGIFRDRTEALVSSLVAGSVYYVQSSLATQEDAFESELDLSKFLWSESNLNEVTSLPKFGDHGGGKQSRPSALELKAQGYSPKVQELCGQFDGMLEKLLQDLSVFLREKEIALERQQSHQDSFSFLLEPQTKEVEPFDLSADDATVLQFVQGCAVSHVNNLIEHVSSKHIDRTSDRGLMLLLGRLYQALPELCPSLEKCVLAPQTLASRKSDLLADMQQRRSAAASFSSSKPDPNWLAIKTQLEQESCRVFQKWITTLTDELSSHLTQSLSDDPVTLLKILPARDMIEISEEAEDGTKVKSKIKVPQHPSVALMTGLAQYCCSIYSAAPYSLPPSVQLVASQQPARVICDAYGKVSERTCVNQMIALQLHFDVHFVSQFMITRDNKQLASVSQEIISRLETHIDPFDLSVFSPHMNTNVKKSVLREHGLLSILMPPDRYTLLASIKSSLPVSSSTTSGGQQEQHNVMWTFTHRPDKIPLIPVPRRKRDAKKKSANTLSTASVTTTLSSVSPVMGRRRDKSPVAKTAGSFFEAMSTSWFGGK